MQKNWKHSFVIFADEQQILYFGLKIKGLRRLLCHSWQLVKDITLWVFILPPWGRAISRSFYALYTGALNGLSRKTIPGGLPHEEANYRCIKDY